MQHMPKIDGGTSQQAHVIFAVHFLVTEQKVPETKLELEQQKNQERGARPYGC